MFLIALICTLLPAQATTYGHVLPMPELLDRSEMVVRGVVADTTAEVGEDGLIWTHVTLDVDETLSHSNQAEVTFRLPGGTVGDLTLSVPGAPVFSEGQDVMVFLDGDRLKGFGQGAFLIEEGQAWRGLGNELEAEPVRRPVQHVIGDLDSARDCIRLNASASYEDGWSLRGAQGARMAAGEERVMSITMVAGLEYRLEVCGDSQVGPVDLAVYDAEGREIAWQSGSKGQLALTFRPEDTGEHFVVLVNQSLPVEVLRSGLMLSLSYR